MQLVLTDRSTLTEGRNIGVMSPSTWRLADLFAKYAFLVSGLGFGGAPCTPWQGILPKGGSPSFDRSGAA